MYIPNPILFGGTPEDGFTLTVDAQRGGLAGYILTSVGGSPATVELNGLPITFPTTLRSGDVLHLISLTDNGITTLAALAPTDTAPLPVDGGNPKPPVDTTKPLDVTTDVDGYQTIANIDVTTDTDGYQTIPGATATADADGYETVQRSTS